MVKITENTKKTNLVTILLVALFIIVYLFVIVFTYNRIEVMALETLLKSVIGSSVSFNEILENDQIQIDVYAHTIEEHIKATQWKHPNEPVSDSEKQEMLQKLLNSQLKDMDCKDLAFVSLDGQMIDSHGNIQKSKIKVRPDHLKEMQSPELVRLDPKFKYNNNFGYIYDSVKIDDEPIGLIVGKFDYQEKLNRTYPSEHP